MASSSNSTTIKVGGTPTTLTNEAAADLGAHTVYQITDATKRVLDPATALTVEVDPDGVSGYSAADPADYTVDYMFGKVTFASANGASALVRVSGKFVPLLSVAEGTEFDLDDSAMLVEDTVFGDTNRSRFTGLQEASGSFTLLALLNSDLDPGGGTRNLQAALRTGTAVLLEYRPGGGADYWRAWVYLKQGSEKAALEGRLEGSMQFSTHAPTGVGEGELAVPTWGAG